MKPNQKKLREKRKALLGQMASLNLLVQGSYLERFSVCSRKNCACHRGKKHGPRSYLVVYQDQKQRQVYIPSGQRQAVLKGIEQHRRLLALVKEITSINLQLMRAARPRKKGTSHD